MQVLVAHRFVLELFAEGDPPQARQPVSLLNDQWSAALQWTRFEAARSDPSPAPVMPAGPATIDPLWDPTLGEPYVAGFRVTLPTGHGTVTSEFAADYFDDFAQQCAQQLVSAGKLPKEQACRYVACAFAEDEPPPVDSQPGATWQVKPVAQTLVVEPLSLADLLSASEPCGRLADDDLPVFIPQRVLDEAVALHERAGAVETGGTLVGHLHRDPERPETFFIQVTAQLPVRHAQQELTRLAFTPESWAEVDGVIRLRSRRERKLGWWHTHPARRWCERCPVENRSRCKLSGEFFSTHDAALHRAVYPMAYSLALVVSDSYHEGLTFPMFGWRRGGRLARRGFHVLHETAGLQTSGQPSTGKERT